MNQLERRYRRVLRLLPHAYRRQWEDDMVAAYLLSIETDDPDRAEYLADFGRPSWSEFASVAGLALRLHLGLAGGRTARFEARVDTVRILVLVWLLSGAVWAVVGAGVQLWLLGALWILPAPPADWTAAAATGPWPIALQLAGLAYLVAYLGILHGRPVAARTAAAVGLAGDVAVVVVAIVDELVRDLPTLSVSMLTTLVVDVVLLWALWTFSPHWAPIRRGPWLAALGIGVLTIAGLAAVTFLGALPWWALEPVTLSAVAVLVLVAVRAFAGPSPSWSLALAILSWTMGVVRVATLPDIVEAESWYGRSGLTVAAIEAAALFALAVPATVAASRAGARLAASA